MFQKLTSFTKKVADLADKPTLNPSELKAQFDAAPEELRSSFNKLVDDLNTLNPASKTQTAWTQATLQNGWVHETNNPVMMRVNEIGQLELKGGATGGTTAGNTTVFSIPLSFLPSGNQLNIRPFSTDSNGALLNFAMWIHASTRAVNNYGTSGTTIRFDSVVIAV